MASKRQNQHHLPSSILFFKIILKRSLKHGHLVSTKFLPFKVLRKIVTSYVYQRLEQDICIASQLQVLSSLQKIPNKFTRKYGGGLPNPVFLKPPDGIEWKLRWTKHDDGIWFKEGWKEFATYYSLDHGHLVVYEYKENSSYFEVRICDTSALEIEYPFRGTQDEQNNPDETSNDSIEILDKPPPYQKTKQKSPMSCKKRKTVTSTKDEQDNSDQISDDDSIEILDDPPPFQKTRKNSPMSCSQPCKKLRTGTCGYNGRSSNLLNMPQHDQIQGNHSKGTNFEKSTFASVNKELDENMDDTTECLKVVQEELTSKIAEALNRATAFKAKTKNPSFMVVLKLGYVNGQSLDIPSQFAKKHLKVKEGDILLLVLNVKSWPVEYIFSKFSAGWKKFASDNHLNMGDVCLFELTNSLSLKVRVFRVSEEPHCPPPPQGGFSNASLEKANEYASENPFFTVKIKPRSDNRPCVPADFATKHFNNKQDLMLQFGKKLWPVKLIHFSRTCMFSRGWALFARETKLVGGDVCVFELINRKDAVLHVHIFRDHHS